MRSIFKFLRSDQHNEACNTMIFQLPIVVAFLSALAAVYYKTQFVENLTAYITMTMLGLSAVCYAIRYAGSKGITLRALIRGLCLGITIGATVLLVFQYPAERSIAFLASFGLVSMCLFAYAALLTDGVYSFINLEYREGFRRRLSILLLGFAMLAVGFSIAMLPFSITNP